MIFFFLSWCADEAGAADAILSRETYFSVRFEIGDDGLEGALGQKVDVTKDKVNPKFIFSIHVFRNLESKIPKASTKQKLTHQTRPPNCISIVLLRSDRANATVDSHHVLSRRVKPIVTYLTVWSMCGCDRAKYRSASASIWHPLVPHALVVSIVTTHPRATNPPTKCR
jgi:hypothetical protein